MLRLSKKILFAVTLLGLCGINSAALAHNPGKVHAIHAGHKHVVVAVHKPHLVPVMRSIVVVKKKQALLTRRLIRASLRH